MKVLAIMGSPRSKGNTYKVTKMVEERMKKLGDVEFEYVFLRDVNLKMCLGCRACMEKGEEFCPLKDDRAMIEDKINGAEGVIFASPTYVGNVSGLMKNFIDRFAYVCHRPRFFKNAMAITTSGGGGAGFMLMNLSIPLSTWGFKVVHKFGVVMHEHPEKRPLKETETLVKSMDKKVDVAAKKFYESMRTSPPRPGVFTMAQFLYVKQAHSLDDPTSVDHRYWEEHGWYDKNAYYFYDTKANILKKSVAKAGSKLFGLVAK